MRSHKSAMRSAAKPWQRLLVVSGLLVGSTAMGCTEVADEEGDDGKQTDESGSTDESGATEESAPASGGGKKDAGKPSPSDDGDEDEPVTGGRDSGVPSKADASTPSKDGTVGDGGSTQPGTDGGKPADGSSLWCSVKAITDKSCVSCHDGKGTAGAPMGLVKHADFLAASPIVKSKKVYETVGARMRDKDRPMPPRGLLPEADLKIVDQWIAAGAPVGSDATCSGGAKPTPTKPAGPNDVDGWDPSKCDAIYEVRSSDLKDPTKPHTVAPGAETHPQIYVDAPWGDEKVQAIAFRPITDNQKVLHHWILNAAPFGFLAGWAPGDEARPPFPEDVGMDMPSGKRSLKLDMHYYNTTGTQPEQDRSGVEICVLKKDHFRPKPAAVSMNFASIGTGGILAPRGAKDKPQTSVCNVTGTTPVHLLTAAPHAHKYATHMKFTVKKKDGKEIVMHDQPFKFGEQGTYPLEGGEVVLEAGDTVTTVCSYTNPTNKDIRFGESTESEMCFNFALYYPKGALRCSGGLLDLTGVFSGGN